MIIYMKSLSRSPSIHNPNEGGVIFVPKVVTKSVIGKELSIHNPPAASVRRPSDHTHQIYTYGRCREER